jgi:hypothetical protein
MKQYVYNFVGGGWNTEWATTRNKAIAAVNKRWKGSDRYIPDTTSMRLARESDLRHLMLLFD